MQVDIGQGVLLRKSQWEALRQQQSDSRFVKEAATAIWGRDILKIRSVTGTLSNSAKAKGLTVPYAQLTPRKVKALTGKSNNL